MRPLATARSAETLLRQPRGPEGAERLPQLKRAAKGNARDETARAKPASAPGRDKGARAKPRMTEERAASVPGAKGGSARVATNQANRPKAAGNKDSAAKAKQAGRKGSSAASAAGKGLTLRAS